MVLLLSNTCSLQSVQRRARVALSGVVVTHRRVLALDAGGVEAHGWDPLDSALDVEDALVVLLSRLRLGQVSGLQCDWTNHPRGNQDVSSRQDLRTALEAEQIISYLIRKINVYVLCYLKD